jgi:parallel beta-helix repeat protein
MNHVRAALLCILCSVIIASAAAADLAIPTTTVPPPDPAVPVTGSFDLGPVVRGTVATLPIVITSPGTYTLDRDYQNLAGSIAIDVRCSDVVIDGAGHTLDGMDAANSVGIQAHGSAALTGVTVRNIRVTDWSRGVSFWNARGRIDGVTASSNAGAGILLYTGGDGTIITRCTAENNGVGGLSISYAPAVEISSCTARNNGDDGIYVYASNGARITGVTSSGNTLSGIALAGSSSGRISGVVVSGCQVTGNGKTGIYMSRAESNTVVNNRIENSVNTILEGTEVGANTWNTAKTAGTNIVGGPYLGGNWWSGFSQTATDANRNGLADSPYSINSGNSDALPLAPPPTSGSIVYPGIVITAPGTYSLTSDIADTTHTVIVEVRCSNVVIEGNGHRITGGGQDGWCGVFVNNPAAAVTGVTIRNLAVANCHYGIYLLNADASHIEWCTVTDTPSNGMGLILTGGSDGNTVYGNRVRAASTAGTGAMGIVVVSSSQNTITNNEFTNPINWILTGTFGANTWNSARTAGQNIVAGPYFGGNYWAEPDGTGWSQTVADANADGIGDSPYSLATGNIDTLPLVGARPVAGFTATPATGPASLSVQFTDTSTSSPTSWAWSFGDGGTSTQRNPSHTYASAGSYTVSLTASNAAGQSAPHTGTVTVTGVPPVPTAISPSTGTQGSLMTITDLAGTGFISGATVRLTSGSSSIQATNVVVVSPTEITCQFTLPSNAAAGPWNVVVTNPDGRSGTLTDGFTLSSPMTAAFRFAPSSLSVPIGTTGTATLYLDNLAAGFSGIDTTLTLSMPDPTVGEIVGVALPGWAMTDNSQLPDDIVSIRAVDLNNLVGPGGNALIGTVTVRGDRAGRTELRVTEARVDDESGNPVTTQLTACIVDVVQSQAIIVPGGSGVPRDLNGDGRYEDVNGNARADFADIVLYFNQMSWIAENEPVAFFDCNGNGRIDFADVVWLFNNV